MIQRGSFLIFLVIMLFQSCATNQHSKRSVASIDYSRSFKLTHAGSNDLKVIEQNIEQVIEVAHKRGPASEQLVADDLFIKGNDASFKDQSELAKLYFRYAHQLKPADSFLHEKYTVELVKSGDLKKAEKELLGVIEKNPNAQRWKLLLAGIYSATNKNTKAIDVYKKLLKKNYTLTLCQGLNALYLSKDQFSKSEKLLHKCIGKVKSKEEKGGLKLLLAKTYVIQSHYKKGIRLLKNVVTHYPQLTEAWLTLGVVYEEKKDFPKAIATYKKAIKKDGDNYIILTRLTNILIVEGEMREVTGYLQRLVDMNPDNLTSLVKLGIAYSDSKQYDKAKSIFKRILTQVPDSDKVLYYLGVLCIEMKDFEESYGYFQEITKESAFYLDAHLQMANVLKAVYHENKKSPMVKHMDQKLSAFLKVGVDNPDYQMQMAMKLVSFFDIQNRIDEAIEVLGKFRKNKLFTPNHDYYLASLYERAGNKEKAREMMLEIIQEDPKNAQAYNFYGYSLLEEGVEMAKAYQYISKAVTLSPNDAYIRDSLGWYYFKVGKFNKALEQLELAYKAEKREPTILQHIAEVYLKLKKHNLAHKFYMEALKSSTTSAEKDEIRKEIKSIERVINRKRLPASKE